MIFWISLITSKNVFSLSGAICVWMVSLNALTVFFARSFFCRPKSVRKIFTRRLSSGSLFLQMSPRSSNALSILLKLLGSIPSKGAILVAGVPFLLSIFSNTKPMEVVRSWLLACWLYMRLMLCHANLILKSTVSSFGNDAVVFFAFTNQIYNYLVCMHTKWIKIMLYVVKGLVLKGLIFFNDKKELRLRT